MRSLSKELRDEFDWKRENLKDKIAEQRRAKQQPALRRVNESMAAAAAGSGISAAARAGVSHGNPFADDAEAEPGVDVRETQVHYSSASAIPPVNNSASRAFHPKPLQVAASAPLDNAAAGQHRAALSPLAPARGVPAASAVAAEGVLYAPTSYSSSSSAASSLTSPSPVADEEKGATLGMLAAHAAAGAKKDPAATYTAAGRREGQTAGSGETATGTVAKVAHEEDEDGGCMPGGLKGVSRRTWIWVALGVFAMIALGFVSWGAVEAARPRSSGTTNAIVQQSPSSGAAVDRNSSSSSSTGDWRTGGGSTSSTGAGIVPPPPVPSSTGPSSQPPSSSSSTGPGAGPLGCEVAQIRLVDLQSSRAFVWHDSGSQMPLEEFAQSQLETLQLQVLYPSDSLSATQASVRATIFLNDDPPLAVDLLPLPGLVGSAQRLMAAFAAGGSGGTLRGLRGGDGQSNVLGVEAAHCATRFATSFSFAQPASGIGGDSSTGPAESGGGSTSSGGGETKFSSTAATADDPSSTGSQVPSAASSTAPAVQPESSTAAAVESSTASNPAVESSTAAVPPELSSSAVPSEPIASSTATVAPSSTAAIDVEPSSSTAPVEPSSTASIEPSSTAAPEPQEPSSSTSAPAEIGESSSGADQPL